MNLRVLDAVLPELDAVISVAEAAEAVAAVQVVHVVQAITAVQPGFDVIELL